MAIPKTNASLKSHRKCKKKCAAFSFLAYGLLGTVFLNPFLDFFQTASIKIGWILYLRVRRSHRNQNQIFWSSYWLEIAKIATKIVKIAKWRFWRFFVIEFCRASNSGQEIGIKLENQCTDEDFRTYLVHLINDWKLAIFSYSFLILYNYTTFCPPIIHVYIVQLLLV